MSNAREVLLDDEINLMLDAYDGSPDKLINNLLGDYFASNKVPLDVRGRKYETNPQLEFPPECNHPEHEVFRYCPYTPDQRRKMGDKPL